MEDIENTEQDYEENFEDAIEKNGDLDNEDSTESLDYFDDEDDDYMEEDSDEEELFRQNPLKAIWIKLKEIEGN